VDLESTKVTVIVDDRDVSSGKLYYMRAGREPRLKIEFSKPLVRSLLIDKGKGVLFTPKTNEADEYSLGSKANAVNQFMALGFGQSGEDLTKN
jgi:hypothetical protein